jgi:hypothetical protein
LPSTPGSAHREILPTQAANPLPPPSTRFIVLSIVLRSIRSKGESST